MTRESWRCADPACGATNTWVSKFCEHCGTARGPVAGGSEGGTSSHSCWTCSNPDCRAYSPGQTVLYADDGPGGSKRGLCARCHFDQRSRPYKSEPGEVCLAEECRMAGRPRHLVQDHMREVRELVSKLEQRMAVRW